MNHYLEWLVQQNPSAPIHELVPFAKDFKGVGVPEGRQELEGGGIEMGFGDGANVWLREFGFWRFRWSEVGQCPVVPPKNYVKSISVNACT